MNPEATFWLIPTQKIKDLIIANVHPHVLALPQSVKECLLEGKVFPIDNKTVLEFVSGTLDEKNKFLLSNCDIRVWDALDIKVKNEGP